MAQTAEVHYPVWFVCQLHVAVWYCVTLTEDWQFRCSEFYLFLFFKSQYTKTWQMWALWNQDSQRHKLIEILILFFNMCTIRNTQDPCQEWKMLLAVLDCKVPVLIATYLRSISSFIIVIFLSFMIFHHQSSFHYLQHRCES